MEIKPGKFVAVTYDLFVGEGDEQELMEKATVEVPLKFVFGTGAMLESFEKKLEGMKVGDSFDFFIPAVDAYGEEDEEHILELPKDMFIVEGIFDEEVIFPGNLVPMMDSNGNRLNGTVVEVNDDIVTMDFNHPLAGEDLHFMGEVIEVREATAADLSECSAEGCGSGGCGSGGCGSGSCGSDDCGCSDEDEEEKVGGCGSGCGCHG